MKSESERQISIEDILRLKRAERPPAEFWTTFDRELRAKQLAALVGRRPWWQNIPKTFPRVFRYRIPLGASAIVALTLLSIRQHRTPSEAHVVVAPVQVETTAVAQFDAPAVPERITTEVTVTPERPVLAFSESAPESFISSTQTAAVPTIPAATTTLGGSVRTDRVDQTAMPASTEVAANLVVSRVGEANGARTFLAQNSAFEVRQASARAAIEPLQQMTPPGESRRSRLLTAMVATVASDPSYRATERAASRIAEDRLYDQIHRFDARGDRLQMKF